MGKSTMGTIAAGHSRGREVEYEVNAAAKARLKARVAPAAALVAAAPPRAVSK